jgi:hypothetical protein
MSNFWITIQTIGIAGISGIIYWLYLFFYQQCLIKEENENKKEETKKDLPIEDIKVKEVKYEEKYLEKFNKMENVFSFQEEDINLQNQKMNELMDEYNKENINLYECNIEKIDEIKQTAYDYMLNKFLLRLQNSYIIENTPIGNVAMKFNNIKGSFEYYSDKNIPYRFLEIVSRKYVTTFHCKPLYVIMDSEIELATQKMKEQKEQEQKEKEQKKESLQVKIKSKDIFANFKNIKPIQINKIPNKSNTRNIQQMQMQKSSNSAVQQILKENANRYTHLGKFSNFILLKAVDKTHHDKNHKLSYRDFLKMNKVKTL